VSLLSFGFAFMQTMLAPVRPGRQTRPVLALPVPPSAPAGGVPPRPGDLDVAARAGRSDGAATSRSSGQGSPVAPEGQPTRAGSSRAASRSRASAVPVPGFGLYITMLYPGRSGTVSRVASKT